MIMIYLDFVGNNNRQGREAVLIIEEAATLGKSPIRPDYALVLYMRRLCILRIKTDASYGMSFRPRSA